MSLLGNFEKLVGKAEHAVSNAIHPQQQAPQAPRMHGDPGTNPFGPGGHAPAPLPQLPQVAARGYMNPQGQEQWNPLMGGAPMPDPATIPSFMGNQYAQNPTSPQFRGVDPRIFGYPPDNSSVDNQITNQLVRQGRLPSNQAEIYPGR